MALDGSIWLYMALNGSKWLEMAQKATMALNGSK